MKTFLILLVLILFPVLANAQLTCTRVTAISQNCLVTVTWQPSAIDSNHSAPTNYIIRRADAGGTATVISTVAGNVTSFQNTFTDTGQISHCWDLIARNAVPNPIIGQPPVTNMDSQPSNGACWTSPAIATLPPNTPQSVTLSAVSPNTLRITWDDVNNESGYEVWGKPAKGQGRQYVRLVLLPSDSTTWDWSGLKPYSSNCMKVRAMAAAGLKNSNYSNAFCATTLR